MLLHKQVTIQTWKLLRSAGGEACAPHTDLERLQAEAQLAPGAHAGHSSAQSPTSIRARPRHPSMLAVSLRHLPLRPIGLYSDRWQIKVPAMLKVSYTQQP
jgi:hypothetical protein